MELDHVIHAAGPDGLDATAAALGEQYGVTPVAGGRHTTFGTRNALLPLADLQYVEVVAVDDEQVAATHPFGRAVAAATASGGGWMGWAVRVDDPAPVATRLDRPLIPGGRRRPDGVELAWRQVGTDVLVDDPLLPFFLTWDVPPHLHPAADGPSGPDAPRITGLILNGTDADASRLAAWLGEPLDGVALSWLPPTAGRAGLVSVTVEPRSGGVPLA